jgi:hypothetical protein
MIKLTVTFFTLNSHTTQPPAFNWYMADNLIAQLLTLKGLKSYQFSLINDYTYSLGVVIVLTAQNTIVVLYCNE